MHTLMVLRHPADLVLNCSNHHEHRYGGEAFSWPCVKLLYPPSTPSTLTLVKAISCSVSERPHWCLLVTVLRHPDEHVLTAPTTTHALNPHSVEASSWPCVKLLQHHARPPPSWCWGIQLNHAGCTGCYCPRRVPLCVSAWTMARMEEPSPASRSYWSAHTGISIATRCQGPRPELRWGTWENTLFSCTHWYSPKCIICWLSRASVWTALWAYSPWPTQPPPQTHTHQAGSSSPPSPSQGSRSYWSANTSISAATCCQGPRPDLPTWGMWENTVQLHTLVFHPSTLFISC